MGPKLALLPLLALAACAAHRPAERLHVGIPEGLVCPTVERPLVLPTRTCVWRLHSVAEQYLARALDDAGYEDAQARFEMVDLRILPADDNRYAPGQLRLTYRFELRDASGRLLVKLGDRTVEVPSYLLKMRNDYPWKNNPTVYAVEQAVGEVITSLVGPRRARGSWRGASSPTS